MVLYFKIKYILSCAACTSKSRLGIAEEWNSLYMALRTKSFLLSLSYLFLIGVGWIFFFESTCQLHPEMLFDYGWRFLRQELEQVQKFKPFQCNFQYFLFKLFFISSERNKTKNAPTTWKQAQIVIFYPGVPSVAQSLTSVKALKLQFYKSKTPFMSF